MAGRVIIGTSSWADEGFVLEWYPRGLPSRERLAYYSKYFAGVEVNSTFYRLPSLAAVKRWATVTPTGFTFDVKLHRVLSRHVAYPSSLPASLQRWITTDASGRVLLTRRLQDALLDDFLTVLEPLRQAGKLGSLLLQLSPSFSPDDNQLSELDSLIGRVSDVPLAIEFRHRAWVHQATLERTLSYLADRDVALVCVDAPPGEHHTIMPSDLTVVTSQRLAYLRAHGRNTQGYLEGRTVAERFAYRYADVELTQIIERAARMNAALRGGETRVMLNNNRGRDAPDAAVRMLELMRAQTTAVTGARSSIGGQQELRASDGLERIA